MRAPIIEELIDSLPGKKVLVIGDLILDEYTRGQVSRLSPEAPVPVIDLRAREFRPGGAANVAANIAALESTALLVGLVGHDEPGERLLEQLRRAGVEVRSILTDSTRPTTAKTRVVADGKQILRLDVESRTPMPTCAEDNLLGQVLRLMPTVEACILSDYGKGVVSSRLAQNCIAEARKLGKPVMVDPKSTHYTNYRGATVVKPNKQEVERAFCEEIRDNVTLRRAGQTLLQMLRGTALLITQGAQGMCLFQEGAKPKHFPACAPRVFDVTGAGDTVVTTLTLAMASGSNIEQAVRLANLAAGIVVGKPGAAVVTVEELLNHLA